MTLGVSVAEIVENSNNPLLAIHPSWKRVLLGDVARVLNGFAFKSNLFNKDNGFPLIRIRDIGNSETDVYYTGEYDETYVVKHGDLLVGMDGDFNSARWTGKNALLNQRVCKIILESPEYHPKFLEYALPGYLKAINDHTSAVTVKHLSSKTITEIPLPFPPLPEQERIVAKIEELFTQLEAGTAALERVQAGLKRYKASVLKSAFEGKLLGSANNHDNLPNGWQWKTIKELASNEKGSIQSGPFGSQLLHSEFQDKGVLAIGIDNVLEGSFSLGKQHRISNEKYEYLKKFSARPLDVLITVMATVGRCCVVPENIEPAIITKHVYRISVDKNIIDPYYLMYSLSGGQEVRKQLFGEIRGQTRPGINGAILKEILIPVPPLEEQRQIVAEVERRLSLVAGVESTLAASLSRAGRLRQSILKSAFEGRLV